MRIAHADVVHVVERVADIVDARAARTDALRDQARPPMQVELAHVRRMQRISDESERAHFLAGGEAHRYETRLVNTPRHLAVPKAGERAPQPCRIDAIRHAPA